MTAVDKPSRARRLLFLEESPGFEFFERVAELLLRAHHDRTVLGDRIMERFSGDSRALQGWFGLGDSFHWPNRHGKPLPRVYLK